MNRLNNRLNSTRHSAVALFWHRKLVDQLEKLEWNPSLETCDESLVALSEAMTALMTVRHDLLKKELKGDREELNKQLMELYKERGVNPAAGCLPLIIQMPIWFALFRVLRSTDTYIETAPGETINASFLGMDLTISPSTAIPDAFSSGDYLAAIPYIILLIFIVLAGFYQQYQTTSMRSTGDDTEKTPQQQSMQTAMKIMPLFFGFITWTLTAYSICTGSFGL